MRPRFSVLLLPLLAATTGYAQTAAPPPQPPTAEQQIQALEMLRSQALDREKAFLEAAFQLRAQTEAQAKQIEDLQKQLEAAKAAAQPKVANAEPPK